MKALFALALIAFPAAAHADVLEARLVAYDAILPCAAQLTNLGKFQVDISVQTGTFFGSTPAMYERCVAPRLRDAGYKAPKFTNAEFMNKWQSEELASFMNEVAVRMAR